MARQPITVFNESAGNGPLAATAAEVCVAAASALPRAHGVVQSIIAERRGGMASGQGMPHVDDEDGSEGRKRGVEGGTMITTDAEPDGFVSGLSKGGDGAGAEAAGDMVATDRKDSALRASACQSAVEEWWERQRVAVEEGLQDREQEAADRRCDSIAHLMISRGLVWPSRVGLIETATERCKRGSCRRLAGDLAKFPFRVTPPFVPRHSQR